MTRDLAEETKENYLSMISKLIFDKGKNDGQRNSILTSFRAVRIEVRIETSSYKCKSI